MGVLLKYTLGWAGGLVLWEKSRDSVFNADNVKHWPNLNLTPHVNGPF